MRKFNRYGMYGDIQRIEIKGTSAMLETVKLLTSQKYAVAIVSHNELWDDRNSEFYDVYVIEYSFMDIEYSGYTLEWITEDELLTIQDMRLNSVDDGLVFDDIDINGDEV